MCTIWTRIQNFEYTWCWFQIIVHLMYKLDIHNLNHVPCIHCVYHTKYSAPPPTLWQLFSPELQKPHIITNSNKCSISIPLYSVRITFKDGRWMKPIRRCRDGKSEHYWPLDIIYIPPDSAICAIYKTPWLNLIIMHKPQNTSTSPMF